MKEGLWEDREIDVREETGLEARCRASDVGFTSFGSANANSGNHKTSLESWATPPFRK